MFRYRTVILQYKITLKTQQLDHKPAKKYEQKIWKDISGKKIYKWVSIAVHREVKIKTTRHLNTSKRLYQYVTAEIVLKEEVW